MSDLEDTSHRLVVHVGIGTVTLILVVPVNHIYGTIRTVTEIQPLRPRVVRDHKIISMRSGVAGSFALKVINVYPCTVDVVHEKAAAVLLGPAVAQVDHRACMRVSAALNGRP